MKREKLTVIVPVYNDAECIPIFLSHLIPICDQIKGKYETDVVFLNNCSTDQTHVVISQIIKTHPNVYEITMSKNVGYQKSIECGLRNSEGDLFVVIDVDGEDPPFMIMEFLQKYEEGYDLVYGIRSDRVESRIMKKARKMFYKVTKAVADEEIILYMAEFSLFNTAVKNAIIDSSDSFPFLRSSLARVGFDRFGISYKRQNRYAGETNYNLRKMFIFAVAALLSSTTLPLRMPVYAFLPFLTFNCIFGLNLFNQETISNVLTLLIGNFLYFGFSICSISLYLARTYKNGLGIPNSYINFRKSKLQK
jgi:glycosyltransferase involved in cell wall biosynthesis